VVVLPDDDRTNYPFDAGLLSEGLNINACSLSQLERFGQAFPGKEIGLRFNPGMGSGGTTSTNVGGPSSSFGIWFESLPEVKALVGASPDCLLIVCQCTRTHSLGRHHVHQRGRTLVLLRNLIRVCPRGQSIGRLVDA